MAAADLVELLDALAAQLGEVTESRDGGATAYERVGTRFARSSPEGIELRLPPDIAEAALRTPDTEAVAGQPGWVRFRPRSTERHVSDRAEAWFRTAWRHAGPK